MRRVLVTRPEPGASDTAKKLAALGFEPILLPLTRIAPLLGGYRPQPEDFGAVAISSANAVRHAPPALLKHIAKLPVYAVGEKTGRAARKAGLPVADSGAGNAEHLLERIIGAVAPGTRILLLCGRVRRDILEQGLARANLPVTAVETYDTIPVSLSADEVAEVLGSIPVNAALIYSGRAAEIFERIAGMAAPLLKEAECFVISERVARKLPGVPEHHVHVAQEPTEEAMLSMLTRRN